MRDITATVLKQNFEFGRPVRMNVTRVDNYVSMAERIFKIFGAKEMVVRVKVGGSLVEERSLRLGKAKSLVRWYGEKFFMGIHYSNEGVLILSIIGIAPEKEKKEGED